MTLNHAIVRLRLGHYNEAKNTVRNVQDIIESKKSQKLKEIEREACYASAIALYLLGEYEQVETILDGLTQRLRQEHGTQNPSQEHSRLALRIHTHTLYARSKASLGQFDATETNLARAEDALKELTSFLSKGDNDEDRQVRVWGCFIDLCRVETAMLEGIIKARARQ